MAGTFIIAEAGVNHDGDLDKARRMIEVAASSGADAVKFQSFVASDLASPRAMKADYQKRSGQGSDDQLAMLSQLELSPDEHAVLVATCADHGIEFLSTPFGLSSLEMLIELGMQRVKIASGEITNGPLLHAAGRTGLPIILSTGMSNLPEVEAALKVVAHAATSTGDPSAAIFTAPLDAQSIADRVTVLHCTSEYPAAPTDVNLNAMATIATQFGLPVGYSDHTTGLAVPVAAVARGATIVEKHFTLDRTDPGPDHAASLEPAELATMVAMIRDVELALGDFRKEPTAAEIVTRGLVRRSITAAAPIARGEPFSAKNLTSMRPDDGLSPMRIWDLIGRPSSRDYAVGDPIDALEASA